MSAQQQSQFTGIPPLITTDTQFQTANVTGSMFLSTPGTTTFLQTSVGSRVGLFGVTPVSRPTTAISGVTVASTGAGNILNTTTFGSYTIAQVVAALISVGILATV